MSKEAIKRAANRLGMKPLKSDNIALGSIIPLPNGKKGVIVEEVTYPLKESGEKNGK